MSKLFKQTGAQNVMRQEFVFNFDDTMVNVAGALADFKTVGTPAFDVIGLPPRCVITGGDLIVETAYATSTVATASVGDSGSATRYLAATDLKAAARTALTGVGYVNTAGSPVRLTFNITAANATAGRVRVQIEYTIDGRVNEVNHA